MSNDNNRYNGWANYETWLYVLHVDNDSDNQECVLEAARVASETPCPVAELGDQLKNDLNDAIADKELDGLLGDLLNAAAESINWYEVATHFLEAVEEETKELA